MSFALPAHLVPIVRLEPESDFFKLKIGLQSDTVKTGRFGRIE